MPLRYWDHIMTSSNHFLFLALCQGNPPVTGGFPSQRPVTRSFDVYFDLRLNIRLCKQSRRRWFETSSRSLWRHCNKIVNLDLSYSIAIKCKLNYCLQQFDHFANGIISINRNTKHHFGIILFHGHFTKDEHRLGCRKVIRSVDFFLYIITHPCPYFSGGLTKPPVKLGHG